MDFTRINTNEYNVLIHVLVTLADIPLTHKYIKKHFFSIFEALTEHMNDEIDLKRIPSLFNKYNSNYNEYLESDDGLTTITALIENVLKNKEKEIINENRNTVTDIDSARSLYYGINDLGSELISFLLEDNYLDSDFEIYFDKSYWNEFVLNNNPVREYNYIKKENYLKELPYEGNNEDKAIKDLFFR